MLKKKKRIYLTLGRRFVILASVTFLLPLAIFACFSSRNYGDGINLKLQQMTDSTLALVDKNIDYIIYDIESTSALITTNASVQSLLLENGPQYSLAYRRKERSVWNTVINVTNNKDFLDIIFLANEHTAITKYRSSLAGEPIENYATLIASDWYKDLLSLRGKGAWYSGAEIPGFSSNLLAYEYHQIPSIYSSPSPTFFFSISLPLFNLDFTVLIFIFNISEISSVLYPS